MNPAPLVKAIVAAMIFLEEGEPNQVDPDSAVACMENMAYELLQLAGSDRAEFMSLTNDIANGESDERVARFVRDLPFAIGMTE